LLEFRYYDERLDSELARIDATLQHPRRTDWIVGRRCSRAARQLQSAFIDVNELTDPRRVTRLLYEPDIHLPAQAR
jgi:hypothetical protein